jgi:hypothetical protein
VTVRKWVKEAERDEGKCPDGVWSGGREELARFRFVRDVCAVDGSRAALLGGYRTMVAEVSGSIHLRRFCGTSLCEGVEPTVPW